MDQVKSRESRQILCCSAYTWAKWISLIDTVICVSIFIFSLMTTQVRDCEEDELFKNENRAQNAYIRMGSSFLSLLLPVLLHLGIKNERADYLHVWLIVKKIFTGIIFFVLILIFLLSPDVGIFLVFLFAIPLGISLFTIWVVGIYRDELIAYQTLSNPGEIGLDSV